MAVDDHGEYIGEIAEWLVSGVSRPPFGSDRDLEGCCRSCIWIGDRLVSALDLTLDPERQPRRFEVKIPAPLGRPLLRLQRRRIFWLSETRGVDHPPLSMAPSLALISTEVAQVWSRPCATITSSILFGLSIAG